MRFDFLDRNSGVCFDTDAACFVLLSDTFFSFTAVTPSSEPLLLNITGKLMAKIKNPVKTPMSVQGE